MGLFNLEKLFGMTIRESANDGSDFTNPDADYRRLFLGEDGQLHVKDSAGAVTDIGGGSGNVATDAIWDAAGDLAVGTGANTAAKLTMGAAGGAVSRVNGAVAWNSGTGFPTAATGDRYWRTDLGLEAYYDGTRWLTTTQYSVSISPVVLAGISASGVIGFGPAIGGLYDMWGDYVKFHVTLGATNDATKYWTVGFYRMLTAGAADTAVGTDATTISLTANQFHQRTEAIGALLGTNVVGFYLYGTKVSTPSNLIASGQLFYRMVLT